MEMHYIYVFSCLMTIFLYLIIRRNDSLFKKIVGPLAIVLVTYFFSYERPISRINELLLVAVLPVMAGLAILFLTTANFADCVNAEKKQKKILWVSIMVAYICQLLMLFVVYGFPWVKDTFMLDNVEAVVFTLKASKDGALGAIEESFSRDVFAPSLKIVIVESALVVAMLICIYFRKKTLKLRIFQKKIFIERANWLENFFYGNLLITLIWFVLAIMSIPVLGSSALDIYKAYTKDKELVSSALYEKYYVQPDLTKITFEQKKNLIFIMLESMGAEHIEFLSELKALQENNLSFKPGGESVATQGWTIGSQIAKYCGIPLKFPAYDSIQVFLPNALCMQDVLADNGYKQLFVQGTDKCFASFGYFLETHSDVETHDFSYFFKSGRVKKQTSGWGIDDFTLFDLLKQDIMKLYQTGSPFAVYAMTMDTHWPIGHVDGKCGIDPKGSKKEQYLKALKCASRNIEKFIEWAKQQEWFENTIVVIQGDHTTPKQIKDLLMSSGSKYWYNVFLNTKIKSVGGRVFSGFDMYPTIMEMIGANLQNHKLALGTSLLSNEPTLLELLGNEKLDSLLNLNDEMDYYFMGMK